ncbi:SDR family NAD(P)-dependent oxidoreductase [Phytoactinopolyspora halotolerans]|uniref:SDR family oxidoreductase n=1 Tax=Phytoactinopolyspora halotolerans TaxID=1981512 RepID=A0A6L9SFY6_9ACTN|nr:SDR family oxidoreductase [Phytoactinopolyspora halotolerans]NEE04186.1 SDR family oxidoreductase [Phytoactinopolyspora halotolerans]
MAQLNGVIVATGAASGIGRASAEVFAEQGAVVLGVDVADDGLATLRTRNIETIHADVTSQADCVRVAERAAELGPVRGLFNCAGLERHGSVVDTPEDDWDRVQDVNLKSIYLMSKAVIPRLHSSGGGAIVNMSSIQAHATQTEVAAYAATKGGVISLTRAMALDHGPENIRVTAICPGTIETPLVRANAEYFDPEDPQRQLAEWGRMHALNRIGQAGEVARFAAFLLSDEASFVTGSWHLVDGGLLASF